jgi:hypothetical protein
MAFIILFPSEPQTDHFGDSLVQDVGCSSTHISGLLQQYEQLLEDLVGPGEARELQLDRTRMAKALTGDRNFSISCESGVCYPLLLAMINREDLHLLKSVRFHLNGYAFEI